MRIMRRLVETPRQRRATLALIVLLALWLAANPAERVGCHWFGFTVYSAIPLPVADLYLFADGSFRLRPGKQHQVTGAELAALCPRGSAGEATLIIVGTGYSGAVTVTALPESLRERVRLLPTPAAVILFNQLRDAGRPVAALIHTTC